MQTVNSSSNQFSPKTPMLASGGSHQLIQQNGQNIVVTKLGSITNASNLSSYPIQYVDSAVDQHGNQVYTSSVNQINYTHYADGYVNQSGGTPFFSNGNQVGGSNIAVHTLGSNPHVFQHQGTTIVLQGNGQVIGEMDTLAHAHHTRASPLTVQWLLENYENADGVSLPRSTLYHHYIRHCSEQKIDPMNPASFGKLIRSVFTGLRTRRLGTRGNSKYHYYGIRIKPGSHLNQYVEDKSLYATRNYANLHKQGFKHGRMNNSDLYSMVPRNSSYGDVSGGASRSAASDMPNSSGNRTVGGMNAGDGSNFVGGYSSDAPTARQQQQYLGEQQEAALQDLQQVCDKACLPDRIVNRVMGSENIRRYKVNPKMNNNTAASKEERDINDVDVEEIVYDEYDEKDDENDNDIKLDLPMDCMEDDLITFIQLYCEHCDMILHSVVNLAFDELEYIWKKFWRNNSEEDAEVEEKLTRKKLYSLINCKSVELFIKHADNSFYQSLVEVLIPEVLRHIPPSLTQAIRNFAKNLEGWMRSAFSSDRKDCEDKLPETLMTLKLNTVVSLAQTLRRYTSLNHLAQAARAVLQNSAQIQQMVTDINRVDFHNVQEQASWVCRCSDSSVLSLVDMFKKVLEKETTLDGWLTWMSGVVDKLLDTSSKDFKTDCQQLILKWAYYSSLVIRDLTLRSATSFGSFHLMRLLLDEYLYYLIQHKIADYDNITPVSVILLMNNEHGVHSPLSCKSASGPPTTQDSSLEASAQRGDTKSKMLSKYRLVQEAGVVKMASSATSSAKTTSMNGNLIRVSSGAANSPNLKIIKTDKIYAGGHSSYKNSQNADSDSNGHRKSVVVKYDDGTLPVPSEKRARLKY